MLRSSVGERSTPSSGFPHTPLHRSAQRCWSRRRVHQNLPAQPMLPVAEAVEPVADLVMAAEGRVEAEREAVGDSVGVD